MMLQTKREKLLENIAGPDVEWDVIVIGGGATGLGTALDAGTRGYKTLLLEQSDFAKGTSSRSTKLVHGGVRYLGQGDISLVKEALYERGLLLKNAGHLVTNKAFIIPVYSWWKSVFYTAGLKLYDLLAGKLSFGPSKHISKTETVKRLPGLNPKDLYGGILYHDGQFDDSRLAINLAQTCLEHGVTVLNYFKVITLLKEHGKIIGLTAKDTETSKVYQIKSKAVVNATGVFVDEVIQMDEPHKKPLVKSSQGIHIVVDRSFMPGEDALMIPETDDGRVLFAVPWHGKLLIGTTDTPLNEHSLEPVALEEEIGFVMRTAGKYLSKPLTRKDVRSVFAGLRPLAAPTEGSTSTKEISRSHKLIVSGSGLVTITGGKWTTYRIMAEDTVDKLIGIAGLPPKVCLSKGISIHGNITRTTKEDHLSMYGGDREAVKELLDENPDWLQKLHPHFGYVRGQVIWAVRNELARTVEDVLARRLRALFLDSRAAVEAAPMVASLMAKELDRNEAWEHAQVLKFTATAQGYMLMGH
jgi:glycerol-3-phosphate dehydrogenase